MNILLTGGAGFIASNLIGHLLEENNLVVVVDNLILGKLGNISEFISSERFHFYQMDVTDETELENIMRLHEINSVYHLAANSNIQKSAKDPDIDHRDTFGTTKSVLACMRRCEIKKLFFASTSAVYGNFVDVTLDEKKGELFPISFYGAAKLASEAYISAYAYMSDLEVLIFRFPNVIGPKLTHGVIFDFVQKLKKDPTKLLILGDGTQCKPYIHVSDLVDCILMMAKKERTGVEIYNVGVESATTVTQIAKIVCDGLALGDVELQYTGGNCGWKGDVPKFQYSLEKIYKQGWKARITSDDAVRLTVQSIIENGECEK